MITAICNNRVFCKIISKAFNIVLYIIRLLILLFNSIEFDNHTFKNLCIKYTNIYKIDKT